MAISAFVVGVLGLVMAVAVLLRAISHVNVDPREPPVLYPKIPFVGHLISMFTEGPLYLKRLG